MFISIYLIVTYVTIAITIVHEKCSAEHSDTLDRSAEEAVVYPEVLGSSNFDFNYQHPHHPHHHHNHEIAAGDTNARAAEEPVNEDVSPNATEIPLDFIENINKYNVSDVLLNFVEGDLEENPFIQNRFGEEERNAAVKPKAAVCMPELKTVRIASSDDPAILYIPSCTRVERCGGCCSHTLLTCQPTATETVSFQVYKTQYTGGTKLKFVDKEIVLVEKHTKCKCDCRIQPGDCNAFQEYRKSECKCVCTNQDEEKKCYKNNETKLWNPEICACQCREEKPCSTGYYFDPNQCRCVSIPMRRRFATESPSVIEGFNRENRHRYRSNAVPVVPLVTRLNHN